MGLMSEKVKCTKCGTMTDPRINISGIHFCPDCYNQAVEIIAKWASE
jgi:ribosomal protein L37AE/L43A